MSRDSATEDPNATEHLRLDGWRQTPDWLSVDDLERELQSRIGSNASVTWSIVPTGDDVRADAVFLVDGAVIETDDDFDDARATTVAHTARDGAAVLVNVPTWSPVPSDRPGRLARATLHAHRVDVHLQRVAAETGSLLVDADRLFAQAGAAAVVDENGANDAGRKAIRAELLRVVIDAGLVRSTEARPIPVLLPKAPGAVADVVLAQWHVQPGQPVAAGDTVARFDVQERRILQPLTDPRRDVAEKNVRGRAQRLAPGMDLRLALVASADGTVESVAASPGDVLAPGSLLGAVVGYSAAEQFPVELVLERSADE